ncbi:hypothetical protein [Plantactinospora sp. BC1]|uniref:hypothetical protein n=1 Tax=Plantactinospora sp. BC1 TaxID=2108470 RepID=UPI00131F31C7|nr:hypothetical protein [Plantactinospora sp. BC1]
MTAESETGIEPPSELQKRSGAAFDRIVGNSVNTGISAWITATTGSPETGAAIGGMLGPLAEELSFAVRRAVDFQQARGSQLLIEAASSSETSLDDLLDKLVNDPVRLQLLLRSLEVAARATTDYKLSLVANLLATGALATDSAAVDEQLLVVDALGALETPHFRLMLILKHPSPVWWTSPDERKAYRQAWPEARILERDDGLRNVLTALLARLQSLGLARDVSLTASPDPLWELTTFGRLSVNALGEFNRTNHPANPTKE